MDIDHFAELLAEQYDDMDAEQLDANTKFREVSGYTSLTSLLIITMIDEEYNVTVTGDDMLKANTVAELFDIVSTRHHA
jgi:acyl carrier protein